MEIKKDSVKSENQENLKKESANGSASKEKEPKTPAKSSPAVAPIETKAKEAPVTAEMPKSKESVQPVEKKADLAQTTVKTESAGAVNPDKSQEKIAAKDAASKEKEVKTQAKGSPAVTTVEIKAKEAPVATELTKSRESVLPVEKKAASAQAAAKTDSNIVVTLDKLEEKIAKNIKQFKEVGEKLLQADEEIEELEEEKSKKTLKKVVYFWPKVCVEANVCRLPKAVCKTCRKVVDAGISAGKNSVKGIGGITGKCADSLSTGLRLPILRSKINKKFKKLGNFAYQMYTEGRKDILKNEEIEKHISEVKAFEKEIEDLEKRGSNMVNDQPVSQESKA